MERLSNGPLFPFTGPGRHRRVSTTLRQMLTEFSESLHDQGIDLATTRPRTCQLCFEADPMNGWYESFKEMTPEQLDEIY